MRLLTLCLLLPCTAAAQTACSPKAQTQAAQTAHTWQQKALAYKMSPTDSGVPVQARETLLHLKSALATAADTVLACASPTASPASLEQQLATLLHANQPQPSSNTSASAADDDDDKPQPNVLGNDLGIHAELASTSPRLLQITISSSVSCGEDNQLLLYQPTRTGWTRALRWSSQLAPTKEFADASSSEIFGDFFLASVLTGDTPADWRVVVAHGTPWCTSRFSRFGFAVLAASGQPDKPRILLQTERGYSRGEFEPRLKASGNTFELRLNADAMQFDDNAFERRVIYRYRVTGNTVERLKPIATNSLGFLDEWLESPWAEAALQTDPTNRPTLQATHTTYEQQEHDAAASDLNSYIGHKNGPVQACTTTKQFQVRLDAERRIIIPGKPGGRTDSLPSTFFLLQEGKDGYQLLNATHTPDPHCTGPDLMHKP